VLLGSFNLDPLSLANLESLVEIDDRATALDARRWFEDRAVLARRVAPEETAHRGLGGDLLDRIGSAVARFTEMVGRMMSGR